MSKSDKNVLRFLTWLCGPLSFLGIETGTVPSPNPEGQKKGTLISEPRLSNPCEMRFFPREKGGKKKGLFKETCSSTKGRFPFLAWEKLHLAGVRKSGLTN